MDGPFVCDVVDVEGGATILDGPCRGRPRRVVALMVLFWCCENRVIWVGDLGVNVGWPHVATGDVF